MIPVIAGQTGSDDAQDASQDTARHRLADEYATLSGNGVAQESSRPMDDVRIKSRPVPNDSPKAVDITAQFTAACAALETGQLVKDEHFTLFESVGALEIMDPKMDSGFLAPGETLEDDYDFRKELLPEEVIGIMDQLLCYEMAWHQGYPLSQTLFISVHIDRLLWPEPKTLGDTFFHRPSNGRVESWLPPPHCYSGNPPMLMLLRAYCLGLIKYCDNVIQRVGSREYFEEEDFSTHTYNRQLLTRFSEHEIAEILEQAEGWLESGCEKDGLPALEEDVKSSLHSRIRLRKELLFVTSPDNPIDQLGDGWSAARILITKVEKSHPIGRPVKEAFSYKIQRRLASTVPPRPVVELDFQDACRVMVEMCEDNLEVVRGTQLANLSPQEIMSYIWEFSSRKPQPLTFSRACLSTLVFGNPNEMYEELLRKDLEELVLPNDPVLDPVNWTIEATQNPLVATDKRTIMASLINDFTSRVVQSYLELWTSLCQNRCRTRRMLCHNLLAFNNLQIDVEALDQELHQLTNDILLYPLASWVYHMKLRQMEWIVQLGLEQEIYLPDELAGMYWWLSSIATTRAELLERILSFVRSRHEQFIDSKQNEEAAEIFQTQKHIESLLVGARGTASLAEALCSIYILLHYLHAVPTPSRPFGDAPLRYELRMKPFLTVDTPQLPPFKEYDVDLHPFGPYDAPNQPYPAIVNTFARDAEHLIKEAKGHFAAMKKLGPAAAKSEGVKGAWEKNVADTLLSCIAAGLAGAALSKLASTKNLREVVESRCVKMVEADANKKYHDWWIVPNVQIVEKST